MTSGGADERAGVGGRVSRVRFRARLGGTPERALDGSEALDGPTLSDGRPLSTDGRLRELLGIERIV